MAGIWRRIAGAHRSDADSGHSWVYDFFFPHLTGGFFLRMLILALLALGLFGLILRPCVIDGASMLPTYSSHGVTLCDCVTLRFRPPRRGEVVMVDYFRNCYLLKRVVALEGDTVEFRDGRLFLNGEVQEEPYVAFPGHWTVPPRVVAEGHCYVVGDNRGQHVNEHIFGQVEISCLKGRPLF